MLHSDLVNDLPDVLALLERLAAVTHGSVRRAAAEIPVMVPLERHQTEIGQNLRNWEAKPLLQEIYAGFYRRIPTPMEPQILGSVVEIGSGIGKLKSHLSHASATDLFPNPWLDLSCDGYEPPFCSGTISHLVLFDVFHHLRAPNAFLKEARRVLAPAGRVILVEPYISLGSFAVYGLFHHEPLGWRQPFDQDDSLPRPRDYYRRAGQRNAAVFSKGNDKLAQRLECVSHRGIQLFPLPAVRRLQQTSALSGRGPEVHAEVR